MACAGYLVLDNARVVYAELLNGELICSEVSRGGTTPTPEHDDQYDTPPSEASLMKRRHASEASLPPMSLPLLALKPLQRRVTAADVLDAKDYGRGRPVAMSHKRVIRLSGHVVDVVDKEGRVDVPCMSLSFQVVASKMLMHEDGSYSTRFADSVVLTAVDQASKAKWVHHIRRWRRYGWREVAPIQSSEEDYAMLHKQLELWQCMESKQTLLSYQVSRSRRRRFSRALSMYMVNKPEEEPVGWLDARLVGARMQIAAERL